MIGSLLHDYEAWLEQLAPHEPTGRYHHNRTGEDNADAHLKRQIMGREVVVALTNGVGRKSPRHFWSNQNERKAICHEWSGCELFTASRFPDYGWRGVTTR